MSWYSALGIQTPDVLQLANPASGDIVIVQGNSTIVLLTGTALLAAVTITFPSNPDDLQRLTVSAAGVVTLLTMNGGTIKGALAGFSANGFARYIYSATQSAWYRIG